jgi:hypothetical protein
VRQLSYFREGYFIALPSQEGFVMLPSLPSQIPSDVQFMVKGKSVVETSFATGPGFCAGKVDKHDPGITFDQGLAWLERYREHLKGGCLIFADESRLWFSWQKFDRYEAKPKTARPEPGIEMADLTDPNFLKALGMKRVGNKIVSDDAEAVVFGEYENREIEVIKKRETKMRKP